MSLHLQQDGGVNRAMNIQQTVKQAGENMQQMLQNAQQQIVKPAPDAWLWLKDGKRVNAFIHEPDVSDEYWEGRGFTKLPLWTSVQNTFQARVRPWMLECFGPMISADLLERGDRLLEEVFEALQAVHYPMNRVLPLRDYTWSRPIGVLSQEIGGVMVTLGAFSNAHGVDMHECGEVELARINQPEIITKIRAKQAKKAADIPFSPLPQAVEDQQVVTLSVAELNLVRQWFECTQDLSHADYLKKDDYLLAEKVYAKLGFRVPNSVTDKAAA